MQQKSCAVQQGESRRSVVQRNIYFPHRSIGILTPATVTLPADHDTGRCYVPAALGRPVAFTLRPGSRRRRPAPTRSLRGLMASCRLPPHRARRPAAAAPDTMIPATWTPTVVTDDTVATSDTHLNHWNY